MKELLIEKAKAYDDALAHAKLLLKTIGNATLGNLVLKNEFENMFPELKKSEDDGIEKEIVNFINHRKAMGSITPEESKRTGSWIAWLEKQGEQKSIDDLTQQDAMDIAVAKCFEQSEQKPTDKVEPKFKVGDKIRKKTPSSYDKDMQVARIEKDYYVCNHIGKFSSEVVPFSKESIYELIEQKPAWSEEDESMLYGVMETERYMLDVVNGIKKFDVGNGAIRKACTEELNWLESLKDRVLTQPKFEWNEEDEDILNTIINHFEIDLECTKNDDIIRWLKSLRPQNTWKPSEEQMMAIDTAINVLGKGTINGKYLIELQEQLKKLK